MDHGSFVDDWRSLLGLGGPSGLLTSSFVPSTLSCVTHGTSIQQASASDGRAIIIHQELHTSERAIVPRTFIFFGPRGPLGLPSLVSLSVRKKNLDQLYSSLNHHRTTANLSDIVWCMSGGVWIMSGGVCCMSGGVWWCQCILADGEISSDLYRLSCADI